MRALVATRVTAAMAALSLIVAGVVVAGAPAYAATITVTSTIDRPVDCDSTELLSPVTLRSAICVANNLWGSQVVSLPAATYQLAAELGPLVVGVRDGSDLTIVAPGGTATIASGGTHRVMTMDPEMVGGVTVRLNNLTITGGVDNTFGGGGIIAGSYNAANPDTLIVTDSVFHDNRANTDADDATNRPGGAIQFIGGTLTVENSEFSENSSGSSAGGAIAYQAVGSTGQALTISGSTFSGNSTRTTGVLPNGGAAVVVDDTAGSAALAISDSSFVDNLATGTAAANARGAGVWLRGGTLSLQGSTFTGNRLAGGSTAAGAAIHVETDAALNAQFNRVLGNSGGHGLFASTAVNAENNWWGCAGGPGAAGCDTVAGADHSPWLTLTVTADPVDIPVAVPTTTVTASLLANSDDEPIPAARLSAFEGLPIAWSNPLPSDAAIAPDSAELSDGTATAVFTKNSARGAASVTARVDNAVVVGRLGILYPPEFTSGDVLEFTVGEADSFTVVTDAYHPAAVVIDKLKPGDGVPDGLSFQPNPDGTATISGTPADGTGGLYAGTFSATNSVAPDASQHFTLEVFEAPEFTSANSTTMTVDWAGTFQIVTDAHPIASITATGLPAGLSLQDQGDGTAVISGTVTVPGSGGIHPITLTASNGIGGPVTQELTLSLNEAPTITLEPVPTTVNAMTTATFTAAAAIGYPTPTIQWERSTDGGETIIALPGETAAELSFTALQSHDGYLYRAVFSNSSGTAASAEVLLTVGTPPVFSGMGSTVFTAEGGMQSFTVETHAVPHATISISPDKPSWLSLGASADGSAILSGAPPRGSGGEYTFTLTAGNSFDPDATQPFTLYVHEAPSLEATGSAEFTVGTAGTATITADPAGYPLPIEITLTGTLPAGLSLTDNEDGTALIAGNPDAGAGGVYPVTITATGDLGSSTQTLTITVAEAPVVSLQPVPRRVVAGTQVTFTALADGFPAPGVQWQVSADGGMTFSGIDGGTSTTLTVDTVQGLNGNRYRAVFSSASGTSTTDAALLTVGTPSQITSTNETTFIALAADQRFSVTSSGVPFGSFTLQPTAPPWLELVDHGNGTATLSGTPPSGSGGDHSFTITVDNGFGTPDVQVFTLVVLQSPGFTSGASATFNVGALTSFAVTTSPGEPAPTSLTLTGPLPDGVEFAPDGVGGGVISGTPAAGTGGAYTLLLIASNGSAPDTTQAFTLTVTEAPVVTLHPASSTVNAGNPATFTATATGFPIPIVHWEVSTDGGTTFTPIGGESASTLTFTASGSDNGSHYRAVFTNGVGADAVTDAAMLSVGTAPTFTNLATATFTVGGGQESYAITTTGMPIAALSVSAESPLWLGFTDNGDGTGTLVAEPAPGDGGVYAFDLVAGNGFTPDAVQRFTLIVNEAPLLDATGAASFSTSAVGSATITATAGYPTATTLSVTGTLPSGVTFIDNGDGTATISGGPTGSGGSFPLTVTASNGVGTDAIQAFSLTVTDATAVTLHPADATVASGSFATFTAMASGFPAPTVQWQQSSDGGATFTDVVGATSTTMAFTAAQPQNGHLFRAVFSGAGAAISDPALLTVGTPAQVISADRVAFAAGGGLQTATLTASGIPVPEIKLHGARVWLSLVDHGDGTATLSGAPPASAVGAHQVAITASNGFGAMAVQTLTVDVTASGTITSQAVANFTVGAAGSFTVTTADGHPAIASITASGPLPSGVTFHDNGDGTAVLSGIVPPGAAGEYPLTIRASNGQSPDAIQALVLTVTGPPAVTSQSVASFMHGVRGSFTVTTGGGFPHPITLTSTGALPDGLTFADNGDGTATLSGRATAPSGTSVDIVLTAHNSAGSGMPQTLTVTVIDADDVDLPPLAPIGDGMMHGVPAQPLPGQPITVSGSGFAANAPITIGIYSVPQVLAMVRANSSGTFSATVTLPSNLTGSHTLVAAGLDPDGNPRYVMAGVRFAGEGSLPFTGGGDATPAAAGGLLLLAIGFALLLLTRMRHWKTGRRGA